MNEIQTTDVLIVGSGPAGMSTALHLVKADPIWAKRILVIDKATHPREKLCGGGVTRPGEAILTRLGLQLETPQIPIHEIRLVYGKEAYRFREKRPLFRVIRRDEFDHWLVEQGRERGITVREGEAVCDIRPNDDYVEVATAQRTIRAKTVVAADGSRSFIRQKLKWHDSQRVARLLEVLTPQARTEATLFEKGIAIFDYGALAGGLQGYYWDFPSIISGEPVVNRGIFDSRMVAHRPRADLKQTLQNAMAQRGQKLQEYPLKGHPIRWFNRHGPFAQPRIILVGDAAGVDPMVGEGISFALGYGPVAAAALQEAFAQQNFTFDTYRDRILASSLLRELPYRVALARFIYALKQPWQIQLVWRLGGPIIRLANWLAPRSVPFKNPKRVRLPVVDDFGLTIDD